MPELTQLERALRILQRLITHDNVTVKELHDHFDRKESIRTIQRTLNTIQSSHIPLHYQRGEHGLRYYSIKRAFDFIPLTLSPDEILAAILLAQFGELFAGTRIEEDINCIFEKIDQLLPQDSIAFTTALKGLNDVFYLHQPGKLSFDSKDHVIKDILRAIIEKRICTIEYKKTTEAEVKRFHFQPYSILFHAGSIYIIGFQPYHENLIYLALHRIQHIEMSEDVFEQIPDYNLNDFLKNNFGIWHEDPVDIVIRFDELVANTVRERNWHHSQVIQQSNDGRIELSMHVGPSEELIAWILRWGVHAEVLKPDYLRKHIRKNFEEGVMLYNRKTQKDDRRFKKNIDGM
jgi:predicted DNA-binding transcriptional regulator YafY